MANGSKTMDGTRASTDRLERGFKPRAPVNVTRPKPVRVPEPTRPSGNGHKD